MNHKKFIITISELLSQKKVSLSAFGMELSVERTERPDHWRLSALLYRGDDEMPSHIKECISPGGSFKWQKMGPHLSHDAETKALFLVEDVPAAKEYLPFKELIHHFVQVAVEWDEMFFDLQRR